MLYYVIMYYYFQCTLLVFVLSDGSRDYMVIFLLGLGLFYSPVPKVVSSPWLLGFCVRFEESL